MLRKNSGSVTLYGRSSLSLMAHVIPKRYSGKRAIALAYCHRSEPHISSFMIIAILISINTVHPPFSNSVLSNGLIA